MEIKKYIQVFVTVSYYIRMQIQEEIADVKTNIRWYKTVFLWDMSKAQGYYQIYGNRQRPYSLYDRNRANNVYQ